MMGRDKIDRRAFIATTVGVTATIAGCSSSDDGDDGDDNAGNGNPLGNGNGNGDTEPTETDGNGDNPLSGDGDRRSISFGETKDGQIDEDDGRDPLFDELAEPVAFEGEEGQGVRITMQSEELDPYLVLAGPDGQVVADNDDGADGFNSRIEMSLPSTGTYTIWAGALEIDATGPYTLTLEEVDIEALPDLRALSVGETKDGYVDQTDGRDPMFDELAEPVQFEGAEGQGVRITMRSEELDPYLVLAGPDGEVIADNDDGADGFNSRIELSLPSSGTYTIWAGALAVDATGPYTLTLEEVDIEERTDLRSLSVGETRDGYIDQGDENEPVYSGLAEPVAFDGEAGQTVEITMRSAELDTYLILVGPDGGSVAENDDADGTNSQITHTLQSTGTYTIWATTFSGSDTGSYTLSLEEG